MKDIIVRSLENLQITRILKEEHAVNISIYDESEYFDVADTNYDEAHDIWGEFDYVLMFGENPDYCFISKNMSIVKVHDTILNWLEEIKVCNP